MSKLIYYVAASMDGYIATQAHELDWLTNFILGDDATPYDDFYQSIGAVIMGGKTYSWIMENAHGDWPYKDVPAFILTSQDLAIPQGTGISKVSGNANDIARHAKLAAKGKDVWVVGGGNSAAFFADAGELDQLYITTIPVFLGEGIKILPVNRSVVVTPVTSRFLQSGALESVLTIRK
ncbi:dihydrofolate reductase family protein [Serratia fonticola]|uniref:dihydrofolate reductase family protein n=1 Tax=Serratia fonticola TaxID=47917 RepID=UPI0003A7BCD1